MNRPLNETLILGVDMSGGKDISCLLVCKKKDGIMRIINSFYGEEAEKMHSMLTKKEGIEIYPTFTVIDENDVSGS